VWYFKFKMAVAIFCDDDVHDGNLKKEAAGCFETLSFHLSGYILSESIQLQFMFICL
jgi:hypothetical protein